MTKLLIGADPEFFVEENKEIIPAVGMVAGTKYEPLACLRGAMQVDGLALEFNIDPAETVKQFDLNVHAVMRRTLMEARKNTGKKLTISKSVLHRFDPEVFDALPEESKELGCSASFNHLGTIRISPDSHGKNRVVGGHVHLGWTEDADCSIGSTHYKDCVALSLIMDAFVQFRLAMYLKQNMKNNDFSQLAAKERQRKAYYGRFTEFRPKPYGMEYRSLSNFWIHDSTLRQLVFQFSQEAFEVATKCDIQKYVNNFASGYSALTRAKYCWIVDSDYNRYLKECQQVIDTLLAQLEA